jgi:hypothetical protein
MEVRGGDGIALHLYHSRGNATRNCAGAQETAWHLFCKRAAKNAGWSTETTVRLPCGVRRADAYRDGEFLEFVHSQSPTYITKHKQLADNGIKCRWIIDSAASFHSKLRSETFDFGDGFRGPLRVKGLFKQKMADLVDGLGHANCFVYYRWAVWQCVGRDEWEILPQLHDLQQWCTCDGGFNNEIIIGHQRSSEHGYRVEVRPVDFRTNWRTQVEYLFEEVLGARHRLALEALAVAAESAAKASRSAAAANDHGPGEPICRKPQSSRYLTLDQIKVIGQRPGNRIEYRKPCPAIGNVDPGAVMEAGAKARIDHPVRRAGGIEDVAIGCKCGDGQGLREDTHHDGCSALADGAGVFHPRTPGGYF